MLYKTSMTSVARSRIHLCAKINIGGECLNEYSKSKLIKLYDCKDKCKTVEYALKYDEGHEIVWQQKRHVGEISV